MNVKLFKGAETVLEDPSMTLAKWKEFIEDQIKEYGPEAVMETDAGHNNVELKIMEKK